MVHSITSTKSRLPWRLGGAARWGQRALPECIAGFGDGRGGRRPNYDALHGDAWRRHRAKGVPANTEVANSGARNFGDVPLWPPPRAKQGRTKVKWKLPSVFANTDGNFRDGSSVCPLVGIIW